jgi:hypothetical protein
MNKERKIKVTINLTEPGLLNNSRLNKGYAFTESERGTFVARRQRCEICPIL